MPGGEMEGRVDALFSTPLWRIRCPVHERIKPPLIAEIERMRLDPRQKSDEQRSNIGGWRSADLPLDHSPWREFAEFVHGCVMGILNQDVPFVLQAWVNLHDRNGYNRSHVHPGCLLSGVYYLRAPEGSGAIILEDPRPQAAFQALHDVCRLSLEESKAVVPAREGMLLLFPSWLSHSTEPNGAESSRISIPVNVMPR